MASQKRRVRRQSIDAAHSDNSTANTTAEGSGGDNKYNAKPPSQAFEFECPLCGGEKGRANISARSGEWVISCWSCSQRSYLFELAEAIGLKDAFALKEDAHKYLKPLIRRHGRKITQPDPLPTEDDLVDWQRRLRKEPDVMSYLLTERGLSAQVIRQARLGYDGRAVTIPIHDARTRELVNVRRRYWPIVPATGAKYRGLAGRTLETGGVTVYPELPNGSLILVAGEFDALVLRSHRLPGVSVTTGAATRWRQEWAWMVEGKRVAVIYDADPREQEQAISRASELRRVGAEDAWSIRLSEAGLSKGEDVTDWFVKYGQSRDALLRLIKDERRKVKR